MIAKESARLAQISTTRWQEHNEMMVLSSRGPSYSVMHGVNFLS